MQESKKLSDVKQQLKESICVHSYHEQDAEELAEIYYHTIHKINSRDYSKE